MRELPFDVLRGEPPAEFARALRARLHAADAARTERRRWPMPRLLASAAAVAGVAAALAVPAVRASAEAFLSLFRVVNFVVVPVERGRLDALDARRLSVDALIGENVRVLEEPGPPTAMASVEQAAAAAGLEPQLPQWLPAGSRIVEIAATREGLVQLTANTRRLEEVMDALGILDLRPPPGLDGRIVTVRVPPILMVRYEHGRRHTRLFEARPPEIGLPPGIDLAALGEIGLRIVGLDAREAHAFAQEIDWRTTLVLPLPPAMSQMRRVTVSGHRGVLVEFQPPNEAFTHMLLWSTGERVFGLVTVQSAEDALAMADSLR